MNEAHQNLADVALGGGESMELAAYVAMQEAACRWVRLSRARLADWTERVDAVTAQLLVETRRVDVLGEAKERDARETQRELAKKSQRTLDDAFTSRRLREARFLRKAVR